MTTTALRPTLSDALRLAARGFHIVPLCLPLTSNSCSCPRHKEEHKVGKRPTTIHGYSSATTDQFLIKQWWKESPHANIGIAVGKDYGLFCLEADMHRNEDGAVIEDGLQSLADLAEANGSLPLTTQVLSGGGGDHFYFRWPAGVHIRSGKVVGYPGLEVKAEGGMCAPPSLHVSGNTYEWVGDDCNPADPPEWLIHLIATPQKIERPAIIIGKQLRELVDETLDALEDIEQDNPTIFVQAGQLVRVTRDKEHRPATVPIGVAEMKGAMTNAANFFKIRKNSDEPIDASPPNEVAEQILSLPPHLWPVPLLDAIVQIPVIRPDGTILDIPGYDEKTHLCYMPTSLTVPSIPTNPTIEQVKASANYLDEFFGEFPYVAQADHANAYAMLFTPFIRHLVRHVPAALVSATKAGTGKGLLTDAAALIATDQTAATLSEIKDEAEWDKRITALLLKGTTFVSIDNVEGVLHSSTLAKTLTSDTHSGRILGFSKMVNVKQRATWIITGNNVQLGSDMPRRCYAIRMATPLSNPWTRDNYKHPALLADIARERGTIIAAILTMIRGWIVAGKPEPQKKLTRLGTFSEWVDTIGGVLSYAGIDGFLNNLQDLYEQADIDGRAWTFFLETWAAKLGEQAYTTSQLIETWKQDSELADTLPDPLATWFADDAKKHSRKIGKALAKKNGTPFGPNNLKIMEGKDTDKKVATFKVTGFTGFTGYDPSFRAANQSNNSHSEYDGKHTPYTPYTPYSSQDDSSISCEICGAMMDGIYAGKKLCGRHYDEARRNAGV